ncbi:MAG TPA: hypothetical protein VHV27_09945 [Phenylobacterium sp.]|nr:hypothetical protein [Phenylobacterium sp.]
MAVRPFPVTVKPLLKNEIVARCQAGETLTAVCAGADMPTLETVGAWARIDTAFGDALVAARRIGTYRRIWVYDDAKAKALIARLGAGERILDILADPAMPTWAVYRRWRATQSEFQVAVAELFALRDAERDRRNRRGRRTWDPALGDRIIARVAYSPSIKGVLSADPALPSRRIVSRWRREQPQFAKVMKIAIQGARRRRHYAASRCTEALMEVICERLAQGATLFKVSRDRRMPSSTTLYSWMRTRPEFAERVAAAYEAREHVYLDRMLEIAEAATPATLPDARRRITILKRRLARIDARREALGSWDD